MRLTGQVTATAKTPAEAPPANLAENLALAEAVPLASALVDHTASRAGVRTLLIKGASLEHHGLRPPRTSADVDVLVDPVGLDDLLAALAGLGWKRRSDVFPTQRDAPHAITLVHPEWPCDLDVHRFFPGFLADPAAVFDALWTSSTRIRIAHVLCRIPDAVHSALIYKLNLLRSGDALGLTPNLDDWISALSRHDRNDLESLIHATGATLAIEHSSPQWLSRPTHSGTGKRNSSHVIWALTGDHGYVLWHAARSEATASEKVRAGVTLAFSPGAGARFARLWSLVIGRRRDGAL